ncbi:MAG: sigma-70 family RNA polymerase sigma factor [Armatimonadetes bacterium]|nr:sigma-70 family RNA polymerase sigma factor [Armatimonadota bacterium]
MNLFSLPSSKYMDIMILCHFPSEGIGARVRSSPGGGIQGGGGFSGMHEADQELIRRHRAGDAGAFEEIVLRFKDRILNTVYRMMGPRADNEDITQEVFIKAYHALADFRGESAIGTWLYRIATNLCLDRLRQKQPLTSWEELIASGGEGALRPEDDPPAIEEILEEKELQEEVQKAIMQLTEKHRAVLVLHDIEGLEFEEIGRILKVPIGTVKSRSHFARSELKERLRGRI